MTNELKDSTARLEQLKQKYDERFNRQYADNIYSQDRLGLIAGFICAGLIIGASLSSVLTDQVKTSVLVISAIISIIAAKLSIKNTIEKEKQYYETQIAQEEANIRLLKIEEKL